MSSEKRTFINVDELMPQITLEQAAAFYGVALPELKRIGAETRTACFLNCGKTAATGDRVLAIQTEDPARKWHCHSYSCGGKGGNLVSLCDLMKPGANAGGRPRGARFKEIAADIRAMVGGQTLSPAPCAAAPASAPPEAEKVNVPLKDSPNERARGLTNLDHKFVVDVGQMSPDASAYLRRRPFLTSDVCRSWQLGYLPQHVGGEDRSGGTLRGKIVYPYLSEAGELLCWFGRDPGYEAKHAKWQASDKSDKEPAKFTYPKGFHRGLELWNQHALRQPEAIEQLQGLGLVVVEGANDVIRLATFGVPAVALCSNTITREQAAKAARLARAVAGGAVTVFLDCDAEGLTGMRQALGYLAQVVPVRLAWSDKMYAGQFKGRQPESLSQEEWQEIRAYLLSGQADGWSLA